MPGKREDCPRKEARFIAQARRGAPGFPRSEAAREKHPDGLLHSLMIRPYASNSTLLPEGNRGPSCHSSSKTSPRGRQLLQECPARRPQNGLRQRLAAPARAKGAAADAASLRSPRLRHHGGQANTKSNTSNNRNDKARHHAS